MIARSVKWSHSDSPKVICGFRTDHHQRKLLPDFAVFVDNIVCTNPDLTEAHVSSTSAQAIGDKTNKRVHFENAPWRSKEYCNMGHLNDPLFEEAAVLTRAIENLCRKLAKFLIGRVSLVSLQEIIKYVFVEEIENKLRTESPEKHISLSKLALLSGLDTRTLTKIRNSRNYRRPFHEETNFLREFAPGALILDIWSSTPPYFDGRSGHPRTLSVSGESPSFESLFQEHGKSRGVTNN